jgi:RNA polymerase sigma-70 factor, ECF subfamily
VETAAPAAASKRSDDVEFVAALKRGDAAAYERLVRLHGGRLLAVARRLLRDEEEAREALQDAFLSAFRAMNSFAGNAQLSTWLHRIVVNAALMRVRARQRVTEEPIDELLPTFREDGHQQHDSVNWGIPPDVSVAQQETRALVRQCIDRLPESYRTVLLLRDIEELDTEETAQVLGLSTNAVKIRLHRARQALRGLLDPYLRGEHL